MKEKLSDLEMMRQDTEVRLQKAYDTMSKNSTKASLLRPYRSALGRRPDTARPSKQKSNNESSIVNLDRKRPSSSPITDNRTVGWKTPINLSTAKAKAPEKKSKKQSSKLTPAQIIQVHSASPIRPRSPQKSNQSSPSPSRKQVDASMMKEMISTLMNVFEKKFEPLLASAQERMDQTSLKLDETLKTHVQLESQKALQLQQLKVEADEKHAKTIVHVELSPIIVSNPAAMPKAKVAASRPFILLQPNYVTEKLEKARAKRFHEMRMYTGLHDSIQQTISERTGCWEALDLFAKLM